MWDFMDHYRKVQCVSGRFYDYPWVKIHTCRFNPFFTSSIFPILRLPHVLTCVHSRLYFYDSRVSWGVPRFQTRRYRTEDYPRWLLPRTSLRGSQESGETWNWCVRGVMGHTPLSHLSQSGNTVTSRDFRCCVTMIIDSSMSVWQKFGSTVPFQTPGMMTQGGCCVSELVWSRVDQVISRLIRNSVFLSGFWFLG